MKKKEEIRKIVDAEVNKYWIKRAAKINHSKFNQSKDAHLFKENELYLRLGKIYHILSSDLNPEALALLISAIFNAEFDADRTSEDWSWTNGIRRSSLSNSPLFSALETKDDVVEFLKHSECRMDYEDYNLIVQIQPAEFKRLIIDHKISLNTVRGANLLAAVQPYDHIKWYLESSSPFYLANQTYCSGEFHSSLQKNSLITAAEEMELSTQFKKIERCVKACNSVNLCQKINPDELLEFLDEHIIKRPDDSAYLPNWNNSFTTIASANSKLNEDQKNHLNIMHAVVIQRLHNAAKTEEKVKFEQSLLEVMPRITTFAKCDKATTTSIQEFMNRLFTSKLERMVTTTHEFKQHASEWRKELSQMVSITAMNAELKNRIHFYRAYLLDRMLGEKSVRSHMSRSWFFSTNDTVQKELVDERLSSCLQVKSVNDFPPAMTRQLTDILASRESKQCKLRALHFAFSARRHDEIRRLLNDRIQTLIDPNQVDLTKDSENYSPENYFCAARTLMQEMWKQIPDDMNDFIAFIQQPHKAQDASLLEDMRNIANDIKEMRAPSCTPVLTTSDSKHISCSM